MRAAVGLSIHTGWAAAVALSSRAEVLHRSRIELADDRHDARFAYHAAAERPRAAEGILRAATLVARERAITALRDMTSALGRAPILAVPRARRSLPALDKILASHPLMHTAEGELYRQAILAAAESLGLEVVTPEHPVDPEVGKMSAPWGKDQKLAAALAWAALGQPS